MLVCQPMNLNELFDPSQLITNDSPVDLNTKTFNVDGIFSTRIFGNMSSGVNSWSCECNKLQAEFNKHVICPECNSEVKYRGLLIAKQGWISLNHSMIHPLFYRYIANIVGKSNLLKILKYKNDISNDGLHELPEVKAPYHGIGLTQFRNNFTEILLYHFKKKRSKGKDFEFKFNFINTHMDKVFCEYFPVSSSRLRPAILIDNEFSFDEINILYNNLIKNANILASLTTLENIPINIETIVFKSQIIINDIYDRVVKMISDKEGPIRGDLLGNRLNFTSRMVITPADSDIKMNQVDLPYLSAIELFKPAILNKLVVIKKCTYTEAKRIWEEATRKFSQLIYEIVSGLAQSPNVSIVINRNPTIALGSMLLLRIRRIKKDITDVTASIHNLILVPLAGDYDGSKS